MGEILNALIQKGLRHFLNCIACFAMEILNALIQKGLRQCQIFHLVLSVKY